MRTWCPFTYSDNFIEKKIHDEQKYAKREEKIRVFVEISRAEAEF